MRKKEKIAQQPEVPLQSVRVQVNDGINVGGNIVGCVVGPIGIGEIQQMLTLVVSSGIAAGAYNVLKSWIDSRNGRKLRLKVGDIEVEATQMPEKDVLNLLDLLQQRADEKRIRDLLLQASASPVGITRKG